MKKHFAPKKHKNHSAFTVVEVVIVIIVISILATISIVSYGQWRERVAETEVKSDMAGVQAGMEDYRNRNNGYPELPVGTVFDGNDATKDIFVASEGVEITYADGDKDVYCVDVQSIDVPGVYMFFSSADGNTAPSTGTCAGGVGATPPSPDQTVFVFDTTAPGCNGTVQLPVSSPTTGGTVDWGDGVVQARSGSLMQHTYSTPGEYMVVYDGPISQASYYNLVNGTNARCLTRVNQWATGVSPTRVSFYNASNLAYVAKPPQTVTDMSFMFQNAASFNQPIGNWDMSNVTNMSFMFDGASSFNQPINSWDTSKVTNVTAMFQGASAFNQPLDSWDISSLTNMTGMFQNAASFNQPIGNWDTSNVTNMSAVFAGTTSFNQPLNGWDVSSVTNMAHMFTGSRFNQPIANWDTSSVGGMPFMFSAANFNQNISGWSVDNVVSYGNFRTSSNLSTANTPPKFR